MTLRILCLLALLVLNTPNMALANDSDQTNSKVVDLNNHALKLFGVSLNALFYLFDSTDHYLWLCPLEESGNINYIRELEKKGYAKIEIVRGLPDGSQQDDTFIHFKAIGKGIEIRKSLLSLRSKNVEIDSTGKLEKGQ